jgi:hypothetical protein
LEWKTATALVNVEELNSVSRIDAAFADSSRIDEAAALERLGGFGGRPRP